MQITTTVKFPFQQLRPEDSGFQPSRKIWPLTEEETHVMFEKTAKFVRENLQLLVNRSYGTHCFRRHNDRTVYCVNEMILKLVVGISGDKLVLLGRYFGKFPKTHKFQLDISALDYLAPYAKNGASQVALVVKNLPTNAGDIDVGSIPWVRKIPWRRAWQPTPVACLEKGHVQRTLAGYRP